MAHEWTAAEVRQWQRIARDAVTVALGAFILIWQTIFAATASPLLVGAGLVLLGIPPALRAPGAHRENGNGQ